MTRVNWIRTAVLFGALAGTAAALAGWKQSSLEEADAVWANQPEPMELVSAAVAEARNYRPTTTAVGTVLALRSVTLSNEVPGTVAKVALQPGAIVEAGTVLVGLDVSVERAELKGLQAQARLAETQLERLERLHKDRAVSREELDQAQAEHEMALAEVERLQAVIERKTVRAPFRARVGLANVHPGQYLNAGTVLTTLQSVDDAVHVDFTVPQQAAAAMRAGEPVEVRAGAANYTATIVAIDSRVDPGTRNATVRARMEAASAPAPGASVRVHVPVGESRPVVSLPVNALRKGPDGDHVFVLAPGEDGKLRAHLRPVESGPVFGDQVLILSGVQAGEQVATTGSFKLREAALVAVNDTPRSGTVGGGI